MKNTKKQHFIEKQQTTLDYIRKRKNHYTFLMISNGKIVVDEDDDEVDQAIAEKAAAMLMSAKKNARYINNYKKEAFLLDLKGEKHWIPYKTEENKAKADLSLLKKAFEMVIEKHYHKKGTYKYSWVTYKLLTEEVFGTGYSNMKQTDFKRDFIRDFIPSKKDATERNDRTKYIPKGKYPDWEYSKAYFVDSEKQVRKAKEFAQLIIAKYNEMANATTVPITEA